MDDALDIARAATIFILLAIIVGVGIILNNVLIDKATVIAQPYVDAMSADEQNVDTTISTVSVENIENIENVTINNNASEVAATNSESQNMPNIVIWMITGLVALGIIMLGSCIIVVNVLRHKERMCNIVDL